MSNIKNNQYTAGLKTDIQYLKGIGPKRAAYLKKIGVETVEDLLFLVPRRYLDRTEIKRIGEIKVDTEATIFVKVLAAGVKKTKNKGDVVRIIVTDQTGILEAIWFNRPDLKNKFHINQQIILSGRISYYTRKQMVNPFYEIIEENSQNHPYLYTGSIIPIYPLTEGLTNWDIRRPIQNAVDNYLNYLTETLPLSVLNKYAFPDIKTAIKNLHFPQTLADTQKAKQRLVYEEFFYLELILALRRLANTQQKKICPLVEKGTLTKKFLAQLPFTLTPGQQKVLVEIKNDMAQELSMNRLLQGDVGSGKTVIAIYAMLIAIENGFQAALMAPTEILAEQHFLVWHKKLRDIGVTSCLLTGSTKAREKKKLLADIEDNTINVVFGTHALIEENIKFYKLGLAIIDEQHRFGVMQRAKLLNKGINPDFLVMTATPIPRTLQMTLCGDLDISILSEKPPGRKKVITKLVNEKNREKVYNFIDQKIQEGRQVYIVCPLIEESEKLDLKAAIKTYEEIKGIFPQYKVGLIHGRLKSAERITTMEAFRQHQIDILVTTTVIEVGVDIVNATVMVIEHPERFGLAQLHQLRGRIGRGSEVAYCLLIVSENRLSTTIERLKYFEKNDDGFNLAEKDLELRGPGQLLGTRQHGLPDLKFANLHDDKNLLFKARDDAFELIRYDPTLTKPEHREIRETFMRKFKNRMYLLRVG